MNYVLRSWSVARIASSEITAKNPMQRMESNHELSSYYTQAEEGLMGPGRGGLRVVREELCVVCWAAVTSYRDGLYA